MIYIEFFWLHTGCDESFKNKIDLIKHEKNHKKSNNSCNKNKNC